MDKDEKKYQDDLKEQGVELDELDTEEVIDDESDDDKDKSEDKDKSDKDEDKSIDKDKSDKDKDKDDKKVDLPEPAKFKKRSIYDEYKDKKSELKEEKEARGKAEEEIVELKVKLQAAEKADTKEEKAEASDDIKKFAEKIGADPEAIMEMRKLFLKDAPPTDETLKKDLEEFKAWKVENRQVVEKQAFDVEIKAIRPQLIKDFPSATPEEMTAVEDKINEISHSKDFHDKTLDYVIFKSKEELSALVSPKKRGMETKERTDAPEGEFVFDPNVDITTLSTKDQELWQKAYAKIMSSEELIDDGKGGRSII